MKEKPSARIEEIAILKLVEPTFDPDVRKVLEGEMDHSKDVIRKYRFFQRLGLETEQDQALAILFLTGRFIEKEIGEVEELKRQVELVGLRENTFIKKVFDSLERKLSSRIAIRDFLTASLPFDASTEKSSSIRRAIGSITFEVFTAQREEARVGKRMKFEPSSKLLNAWGSEWNKRIANAASIEQEEDSH